MGAAPYSRHERGWAPRASAGRCRARVRDRRCRPLSPSLAASLHRSCDPKGVRRSAPKWRVEAGPRLRPGRGAPARRVQGLHRSPPPRKGCGSYRCDSRQPAPRNRRGSPRHAPAREPPDFHAAVRRCHQRGQPRRTQVPQHRLHACRAPETTPVPPR